MVPTPSASVPVPPVSQGKEPSSSGDEGLDVPLQDLVADYAGPILADVAANVTSACGIATSSRTDVVSFC